MIFTIATSLLIELKDNIQHAVRSKKHPWRVLRMPRPYGRNLFYGFRFSYSGFTPFDQFSDRPVQNAEKSNYNIEH